MHHAPAAEGPTKKGLPSCHSATGLPAKRATGLPVKRTTGLPAKRASERARAVLPYRRPSPPAVTPKA
jgi:hypothetical protein